MHVFSSSVEKLRYLEDLTSDISVIALTAMLHACSGFGTALFAVPVFQTILVSKISLMCDEQSILNKNFIGFL